MEAVFIKIINMSITASWLVLSVVILRSLLGKAPKFIRCIMWQWSVSGLFVLSPLKVF